MSSLTVRWCRVMVTVAALAAMPSVCLLAQDVPGECQWMVVDLSGGPFAERYPVREERHGPDLSDDRCRTTELWLRRIPAGTFRMGSPNDEIGRTPAEAQRDVAISKPFLVGMFEVTQRQYELVMGANPSKYRGDARPVESVSYDDLRGGGKGALWPSGDGVDDDSFLGRLRIRTSLPFDLLTEAEWEYACRAGTQTAFSNGQGISGQLKDPALRMIARYGYDQTDAKGGYSAAHTKVGSYLPNGFGLYDMHGNVAEWCLDWWAGDLGTSPASDPTGPQTGRCRTVRGGCFSCYIYAGGAMANRSAYRSNYYGYGENTPDRRHEYIGFRVKCRR